MRTTRSGESLLLLLDALEILDARKIGYAVIGALAASLHGAVRASMDADVVLGADMRKARGLEEDFRAAGFQTQLTRGDVDDPIPGMLRIADAYARQVALSFGLRGLELQSFSRVVEVFFQGRTVKFIGREDFVAMKAFAGGSLDLRDAARAISAAGPSLEVRLVRRLVLKFINTMTYN